MGGGAQSTNGTDRDVMFKSNNSQYTVIWLTKEVEGREGEREGGEEERESERESTTGSSKENAPVPLRRCLPPLPPPPLFLDAHHIIPW